ncbi:MAG: cupin domain-containing protein [Candidatus Zixiibacteriota bacterium]
MPTINDIIRLLHLQPLPTEGGLFVETYKADETIPKNALPGRYTSDRAFASAIYYLLAPDTFSHMHSLKSDEIFHFYLGDSVTMLQLHPDGNSEIITLGQNIEKGERLQVVVPHGAWQGARLNDGGGFALMGTTVAPAYDPDNFELGQRDDLIRQFPDNADLIRQLTA